MRIPPYLWSESCGDAGEVPVALSDAAAVRDHTAAGATAVAVDRPERQPAESVALGPVGDVLPGRGRRHLLLVGQTVHAGDALVRVRLRGGPAEGRLQLVVQALGRADRVVVDVRATEVERHQREDVDVRAECLGLVDQPVAVVRRTGRRRTERDDGPDTRVVLLDDLQRGQDAILHGLVLELVGVLDVDVDRLQVVGADDLLVRTGQCLGCAAVRAELVAAPAAERRYDVTAAGPDRRDRAGVRTALEWPGAVPGRAAAAARQDK